MVDGTVMALLHERIPLSLLCDLLDPAGPRSDEIWAVETGAAEAVLPSTALSSTPR
jgi:hypothetical protein